MSVERFQHKGVLIHECEQEGERRSDGIIPAHPNGMPVSDRGGALFIVLPGPAPFEGTLNPANPPLERMKVMPVIHGPGKSPKN